MAFVQTTYSETMRPGLPGMIANAELANVITRTLASGSLGFGLPVQRSGDHNCLPSDEQTKTGVGAAGVPAPATATIGSVTAVAPAKPGVYTVTCTVPGATNVSRWRVEDPDGVYVGTALGATAFSSQGIGFTITPGAGTAVGEAFTITVSDEVGEGAFIGLSVRDPSLEPVDTIDTYKALANVAIMTKGVMWVTAGAGGVAAGGVVYWDEVTGRYTAAAGDYPIPGAVFDTTGIDGDLVRVALR